MSFENEITGNQKTSNYKILPGGKGINASILLKNIGVKSTAIFTGGGLTGQKLTKLIESEGIDYNVISTNCETRINTKANFVGQTFEMNAEGNKIEPKDINQKIISYANENFKENDILMIMGSLPKGYKIEDLESLLNKLKDIGLKLIFDLSKDHLLKLVKFKPELIKPNIKELSDLFNKKIKTKDEAFIYAQKLIDLGAKRVIVSFDKSGSIYKDFESNSKIIKGIEINEINGSGAGDSMIAAFAAGLNKNIKLNEILKLSTASGTATAASEGIGSLKLINKYKEEIKIENYKGEEINVKSKNTF